MSVCPTAGAMTGTDDHLRMALWPAGLSPGWLGRVEGLGLQAEWLYWDWCPLEDVLCSPCCVSPGGRSHVF